MSRNPLIDNLILLPLSKVYGLVVALRNKMFDRGFILKQTTPPVPTIVVGNIAVGGTGKTPHVEYILQSLRGRKLGMLSRGYKRKTSGFVMASPRVSPEDIGDEAFQIYQKAGGDVAVAVCEKRVEGIQKMLEAEPGLEVIVLDDAFQHRYVKPKVSVVLTEYSRPAYSDKLLPLGHLREPMSAINRAEIVVVTKCPPSMRPMDFRIFKENLNLFPYQKLFFSRYVYGHLVPLFPERAKTVPALEWLTENDYLLVVSGIANPRPFIRHLRRYKAKVRILCFPDHHNFDHDDIEAIEKKFKAMNGARNYIVTTEKDAVRLAHNPYYPRQLQEVTFYLPISVEFISPPGQQNDRPEDFDATLKKLIQAEQ